VLAGIRFLPGHQSIQAASLFPGSGETRNEGGILPHSAESDEGKALKQLDEQ